MQLEGGKFILEPLLKLSPNKNLGYVPKLPTFTDRKLAIEISNKEQTSNVRSLITNP